MFTVQQSPAAVPLVHNVLRAVRAGQIESAVPDLIQLLVELAPPNNSMQVVESLDNLSMLCMAPVAWELNRQLGLRNTKLIILPEDLRMIKRFIRERLQEILLTIESL